MVQQSESRFDSKDRSNRTALFDGIEEGGIRANYSHEIDEHENDRAIDGLQDRVNLLKRLSGDINEEVESHNRMLDRMGNDMDASRGILSGTMDRFKMQVETKLEVHRKAAQTNLREMRRHQKYSLIVVDASRVLTSKPPQDYAVLKNSSNRNQKGRYQGREIMNCMPKGARRSSAPSRFINRHIVRIPCLSSANDSWIELGASDRYLGPGSCIQA
ncbi:hypothetical protein Scep_015490 [Stephania cephalantha]|uniref:t-SNARE coiled-coil homology domain-containing protein n=2 Tax=Magnoliopsida TaxID=3398 RepID=A0AAP0J395_9MAGN